ncbi:Retrotransposon-derived protein PEG10 [Merluccius polli]|uniref:Retrotransposon-derived protein PEG10 n=1 Tax=Merluccius polli TaxID=89951 RepID=A0AA47M1V6_MERPO|nr:Retrotransposon-derived protein PEG10 [Merluccius polli]
MDPAHNPDPLACLDQVETQLQHQEAMLASTTTNIQLAAANREPALATLSTQVQQITATLTQSLSLPAPPSRSPPPAPAYPGPVLEARVGVLECYAGDPEGCNPFITNCSILFALQPYTFATEEARVAFMINNLTGHARLWGTAEWERHTPACSSFSAVTTELHKVFGIASRGPDASRGLRQGSCSVTDYAIDFRIQARRSKWNQAAQVDAFLLGLADNIMVSYDLPASLDEIIALASHVSNFARQHIEEGL